MDTIVIPTRIQCRSVHGVNAIHNVSGDNR